jgi:predicted RNase H-like nuclease (RuvC/YqgF family)
MSELEKGSSAPEVSSSADTKSTGEVSSSAETKDSAAKHIDKLKRENDNRRSKISDLEIKLSEYEAKEKEREEQKLLETNQHQKVIELQKQEITDLKSKITNYTTRETEGKKGLAIMGELKKLGFVDSDANREVAMRLIDKKEVEIDPTSGVVLGADLTAKTFFDKWHHLGLFGRKDVGTDRTAANLTNTMKEKPISEMNKKDLDTKLKTSLSDLLGG